MQAPQNDVITPQQAGTLHGLFVERARRTPDKIAYRHFQRNAWRDLTWREMLGEVARWQAALAGLGLQRGDRVAIMLRNCPCWMMFDQAAMSLGLVVVPLYTVDRPDNLAYIINDADVKVLLFENAEQWQALRTVRDRLGGVKRFVSIDTVRDSGEPRLKSIAEFLPKTAQLQSAQPCGANELASIIYTSGTTGKPKGAMLSHANMLTNANACLDTFTVHGDDLFLSFLPLSHTFERTLGYYLPVMTGSTVAFARSIPQLSEDLQIIRPTILISVPRIYERIYAALRARLDEGSPLKRKLFHLAVETGWARFEHEQGRGSWKPSFLLWPLLQKLVAQKILDKLGGRLRVAISGGAALAPEISRVFIGMGLPVVQGYGLTETSPVISGNRLENNYPDSVGQPIRDVQVKLGEQGALLVKGPNVMLGYWNNPEAARDMIDGDGWLNTGDVAHISETGHIYITGRIKDIIVMSNGEKVPPTDMELALLHDPLFDQVMIFGEAHPYLVALAVLNNEAWQHFAREIGIRADMPETLTDSRVKAKILRRVARNLRGFPGYAKVNRVLLLREPWSIENGLLTPTLKIKRAEIAQQFAGQIKELYERR
ncbi:MAG: long-chain fatty acid--CoA ligase [Gallionella sp.]|nr:long-chain fatty acid--CoA ligase [Gallionella sp.]